MSVTERRNCRIHRPGEDHLHEAVCPACMAPLNGELQPSCWHPDARIGQIGWRCVEGLA